MGFNEETKRLMIEMGVQDKDFRKQIRAVNQETRTLQAEMMAARTSVQGMNNPLLRLQEESRLLSQQLTVQRSRYDMLNNALQEARVRHGEGSSAVRQLRRELAQARTTLNNTEASIQRVNTQLERERSLILRVNTALSDFSRRSMKIGSGLTTLGRNLNTYVTLPFIALGTAATRTAMEVIESENLYRETLGSMAEEGRKWSQGLRENLGINEYEARKRLGIMKAMIENMGITEEEAFRMSEVLVQLNYDMSSFYNSGVEEMFGKLQAGMSGEVEPLKRLGIVLSETNVKQKAYEMGIADVGEKLNDQQKIMARYELLLQTTAKAQGDMGRTLESPENRLRIMGERFKQISIEIGYELIPIVSDLIDTIDPLIDGWNKLSDAEKKQKIQLVENILKANIAISVLGKVTTSIAAVAGGLSKLITWTREAEIATKLLNATFLGTPIGWIVAGFAGLAAVTAAVASEHKKQKKIVQDLTESYKKYNEVIRESNIENLQESNEELDKYQKKLDELFQKYKDGKDEILLSTPGQTITAEHRLMAELKKYVEQVRAAGFEVDETTYKIKELTKVKTKLNIEQSVQRIKESTESRIKENGEILKLIDKYNKLNDIQDKSKAQYAELSNTAYLLTDSINGLSISEDENGNKKLKSIGILKKKKEAIEVEIQAIKQSAYEQAKAELGKEKYMIFGTEMTLTQIQKRVEAMRIETEYVSGFQSKLLGIYYDSENRLKELRAELYSTDSGTFTFNTDYSSASKGIDEQKKKIQELIAKLTKLRDTFQKGSTAYNFYNEKIKEQSKLLEEGKGKLQDYEKELQKIYEDKAESFTEKVIKSLQEKIEKEKELKEKQNKDEIEKLEEKHKKDIQLEEETYKKKKELYAEDTKSFEKEINAKIRLLDDKQSDHDESNKLRDENERIAEIQDILGQDIGKDKRRELEKELQKIYRDREDRKYKANVDLQKRDLKDELDQRKEENQKKEKEALQEKTETLKEINKQFEIDKEDLKESLKTIQEHYDERLKKASITAEAEKLIMDKNQKEIIKLIGTYSDEYEVTGQTLGEKMLQGFKDKFKLEEFINETIQGAMSSMKEMKSKEAAVTNNYNNYTTKESINPKITVHIDGKEVSNHVVSNLDSSISTEERMG